MNQINRREFLKIAWKTFQSHTSIQAAFITCIVILLAAVFYSKELSWAITFISALISFTFGFIWASLREEEIKSRSYYCLECGACGHAGCCEPEQCKVIQCMYGEDYKEDKKRDLEIFNDQWEAISKFCEITDIRFAESDKEVAEAAKLMNLEINKSTLVVGKGDNIQIFQNKAIAFQLRYILEFRSRKEEEEEKTNDSSGSI